MEQPWEDPVISQNPERPGQESLRAQCRMGFPQVTPFSSWNVSSSSVMEDLLMPVVSSVQENVLGLVMLRIEMVTQDKNS